MPRLRTALIPILATIAGLVAALHARADDPAKVTFTILQLNDVYELRALDQGYSGGLARVARLRKELLESEPNTFTVLAGDTLSPSPMGIAKLDGVAVAGRQMVECWNALGLDYATFGNHEFDLGRADFLERLRESDFAWVASNVTDRVGIPFPGVPGELVLDIRNRRGDSLRVGLIGLTIRSNPVPYVRINPSIEAARERVKSLRGRTDVVIAITHLDLEEDRRLAACVPEIGLILGGHEHVLHYERPGVAADGRPTPPIAKADANARSAWVHRFCFDPATRRLALDSSPRVIDEKITPDPAMTELVNRWWNKYSVAFFQENRMFPGDIVANLDRTLDGRESSVRYGPTDLTALVGRVMIEALDARVKVTDPHAGLQRLAIFNSGMIRIDDHILQGPLIAYDLQRTLPYPTTLRGAIMNGSVIADLLERGKKNAGEGSFLQAYDAKGDSLLDGRRPLGADTRFLVCMPDFLIDGREQGFGDLKTARDGFEKPPELNDLGPLREAMLLHFGKAPKLVPGGQARPPEQAIPMPAPVTIPLLPAAR